MTPRWHPSRDRIAGYATGGLAPGPALTVEIHLDACAACRSQAAEIEAAEGLALAGGADAPLRRGALQQVLARLAAQPPDDAPLVDPPIPLPAALARSGLQPPVRLASQSWVAHLNAPRIDGWRTYVLCCPPHVAVPAHGHLGDELIVVIEGAYDDGRRFGVGDFVENRPGEVHDMQVADESGLVVLIAAADRIDWRDADRALGDLLDI